jgi:hypothetical protein
MTNKHFTKIKRDELRERVGFCTQCGLVYASTEQRDRHELYKRYIPSLIQPRKHNEQVRLTDEEAESFTQRTHQ